jgi:6-phosphofructokinase 1
MVVGHWYGLATHVPIAVATAERKRINPEGSLWQSVLETTGQPAKMGIQ